MAASLRRRGLQQGQIRTRAQAGRKAHRVQLVPPERLETRVVPATLEFASGVLTYTGQEAERNDVLIERVTVSAQAYLRLRERGAGVSVSSSSPEVINDGNRTYRILAGSVSSLNLLLGDDDDKADVQLAALPATTLIDAGDNPVDASQTIDQITIRGTSGADNLVIDTTRSPDGWKFARAIFGGNKQFDFGRFETVTLDMSQNGPDEISVNRSITGPNRPVAITLIGGGTGGDSLVVRAPGEIAQQVLVTETAVTFEDAPGGTNVFLGRSDNIAIDQPKAQIEVIRYDQFGEPVSMGPAAFNSFLLDTGATGIVVTANPTFELMENGYQVYDIPYAEQGIAGTTYMDVSYPYRVDFAGYTGERNTLENFQLLSSLEVEFSFFGPWGIIGMPAMVNRVTTVDMSAWSNIQDVEDLPVKTFFGMAAPENTGHLYHVPLELQSFPHTGEPGDPKPTFAPLPFLDVLLREDGEEVHGRFLLDTGAQLSVISTQIAIALGLDKNGNGTLEDEALDFIEVSGIGGTTEIPLIAYDRISIPTAEGPALVFTDMLAAVIDIEVEDDNDPNTPPAPEISGVFGMDFLTSGWAQKVLPLLLGTPGTELDGYFRKLYFDFRQSNQMRGDLVLDVTAVRDVVTPAHPNTFSITHTGLTSITVVGGLADDIFDITPLNLIPVHVDGGPHLGGDTLRVVPTGQPATNDGSTITIPGKREITYVRIETVDIGTGGGTNAPPQVTAFSINTDTGTSSTDRITSDATLTLTVSFSEPTQWTSAGIVVTDPTGANVNPTSQSGSGTSALTVVLPALTKQGVYTLTLKASVFKDLAGLGLNNGTDYVNTFTFDSLSPTADIVDVSPDPRVTPVNQISIAFSEPVFGLDLADFRLVRNTSKNLLPGGATLTSVDNKTWTLGNLGALTATAGTYVLTLNAAGSGVTDTAGNLYSVDASESFIVERPPTLSINDPKLREGGDGVTSSLNFTVRLSRAITQPVTVTVATASGTATSGSDFTAIPPSTLTFNPGETQKIVSVAILGDALIENDEQFFVNLTEPVHATLRKPQGTGTILNDDTLIYVNDVRLAEGNSGFNDFAFTVRLNAPAGFPVSVHYNTVDGTALVGPDYVAHPLTLLTFAPGETEKTVVVQVKGDTLNEPNETFRVRLSKPTSAILGDGTGVGTILNDDPAFLRLAGKPGREGRFALLTRSAIAPLVDAAIAHWVVAGYTTPRLGRLKFEFMDLDRGILAYAARNTIYIDVDASGRGWFVDPTPGDDSEFLPNARGPAQRRVDLLSVLIHEIGHAIGFGDAENVHDVMGYQLGVGKRRRF